MKDDDLLAIYDQEMRIDLRLPEMIYEKTSRFVRDISLADNAGFIDHSSLDEDCAEAEIEAQVAYFEARGMPFIWKVYDHDRPLDLCQRLAAHGFRIDQPNAFMILDLQDAPEYYERMALPVCVKRVDDREGIEAIVRLEEEVYQSPRAWLLRRLLHAWENWPERLSLFAVPQDGRLVTAAWVSYYPGTQFASLLGGATLPEYRKRGYYTALLVTRAHEARQRGCRFLTVDASPMSKVVLEKHGFQCMGYSRLCRWPPGV